MIYYVILQLSFIVITSFVLINKLCKKQYKFNDIIKSKKYKQFIDLLNKYDENKNSYVSFEDEHKISEQTIKKIL